MRASSYFEYRFVDEAEWFIRSFDGRDDEMIFKVSRLLAWSDCCPVEISTIVYKGEEVSYAGWRPCMEYAYVDKDGNEVACCWIPEENH